MKDFKYIKPIDNDTIEKIIEPTIHKIIIEWKNITLHPCFVKRENWMGVCCDNGELYEDATIERFLNATQSYGSSDITVFNFSQYSIQGTQELLPRGYSFPAHMNAFQELWCNPFLSGPLIHIYFSGEPSWILLNDPDLDYFVIFGDPEFVKQILPVSIEEAFQTILVKADNHPFYYSRHNFFASLVHQLRDVYPSAKPGEIIEI